MAIELKQIAQQVILDAGDFSILQAGASEEVCVKAIRVVNTSAGNVAFTLYHDDDGSTYDDTTTVMPQTTIPALKILTDGGDMTYFLNNTSGNMAAKASVADALTITLYGFIRT